MCNFKIELLGNNPVEQVHQAFIEAFSDYEIPVYLFHEIYDYTTSYTLAKDYLEKLKAPQKSFYTFEHSAHSPLFEEPERIRKILSEDVLRNNSQTENKIN